MRRLNFSCQTGAATVIAVLLLLVVVGFALIAALNMSGSDASDSSTARDSTAALFLAESGLERASGRFASGTPCANLVVDGPYTFGAGSLTINATYTTDFSGANLPAAECRVQSVGTVGNVQRTVQGILQLPASSGMVVGNGGVAFQCSGSICTATPNTTTNQNLNAVYCATASSCIAVGNGGATLLWNGTGWSPAGSTGNASLTGVACEPGTLNNCFAVGTSGFLNVVLHWNGAWSPVYSSFGGVAFNGIACTGTGASTTCYAVGSGNQVLVVYNGGGWAQEASNATGTLSAVSCVSATFCWATENYNQGGNFYFDERTSSWSETTAHVKQLAANLKAVSCDTTGDCWAAGLRKNGNFTFAYWDGSTWTAQPSPGNRNLFGIDCLSTSTCWAVGAQGTVLLGSNASAARVWTQIPIATGQQLNAVSFGGGSAGAGSAVLLQWREVVS